MARSEHLRMARQGSVAIARWREQHPGEQLDFSGANLSNHSLNKADLAEADLRGADLIGVRFNEANLRKANLSGAVCDMAYLRGADLSEADLRNASFRRAELTGACLAGADLTGADLTSADLSCSNIEKAVLAQANLSEANLSRANLAGADLSRAELKGGDLTGADLTGANLGRVTFYRTALRETMVKGAAMFHTVLGDCDLSQVVDLDEVRHMGPSAVAIDTIVRSAGRIPEKFLRGTGVPEHTLVHYLPAVSVSPSQSYTCVISYCTKDLAFTERLQDDLQSRGVRCWYLPSDSRISHLTPETATGDGPGPANGGDVDRGVRYYDKLVVVCSGDSLATEGVRDEFIQGLEKQNETGRWLVCPVAISNEPYNRRNRYVRSLGLWRHVMFDFRGWEDSKVYNAALDLLIDELSRDREISAGMVPVDDEES